MKLVLKMVGEAALLLGAQAQHTFDQFGGSVGRAEENAWVLPDPSRKLSRKHFMVDFDGGAFWLTDTSSNGVFLNHASERLAQGRRVQLNNGDQIRFGDYTMDVWIEGAGGAALDSSDTFSSVVMASRGRPPADELDHIDGLLDGVFQPNPGRVPPHEPPASLSPASSSPLPLADDWANPFATTEDDSLFHPRPTAVTESKASFSDHVPSENQFFQPPKPISPPPSVPATPASQGLLPDDWDDDFSDLIDGGKAAAPTPAPVPSPPPSPAAVEMAAAPVPSPQPAPAPVPPPQVLPPSPPAAQPSPASANIAGFEAAWTAFLEGAGIDPTMIRPGGSPEEDMRTIGTLLRLAVGGLRDLLAARAALKNELHIEQTMVRSQGNNPLKFYATTEEALASLIGSPRQGYMPSGPAVREAVSDLKAHEMSLLTSMRESLLGLLLRLDPDGIEQRQGNEGGIGAVLPVARKAKYWDSYRQHFAQVSEQCRGESNALLGREFADVYRRQVAKMTDSFGG